MKTIFRALALAILMTAFSAATVTPIFAQDGDLEANVALYKRYTDNYTGNVDKMKIAIEAGRQYIEKYGSNADYAAQVDFLKKDLPRIEAIVAKAEKAGATKALYTRFDTSVSSKNWDETYSSGKAILAQNPDLLDVILVLGSIGYDESLKTPPNTKYNADTINYAKQAIQKIEAGKTSENYGAYQYTYSGAKEFPDAKQNALGWMNFNIGYLMYFKQNQKKEAIPYLYKATKYNSAVKNIPDIYQAIGASYFDEAKRLSNESVNKIKAANNTETEESKADYALAKGYADRAIDAYARAYKTASTNPATRKEYKDGLYGVIQDLYKFRYDGKIDGIDAYVASVMNKPLPDPTTAITPVVEATPATGGSSLTSSNTTGNSGAETSNNSTAKSGTAAKTPAPAANTAAAKPAAATKAKPAVKKPAPKKKGTR
jgi:hypothetical protein